MPLCPNLLQLVINTYTYYILHSESASSSSVGSPVIIHKIIIFSSIYLVCSCDFLAQLCQNYIISVKLGILDIENMYLVLN